MTALPKKAVVICPGRGTYNKGELGYLYRHHSDKNDLINSIDAYRIEHDQPSITELDQADRFDPRIHTRGDNASSLIYACAYADFISIDRKQFDVVAVTGNSMGWYIALACAGALESKDALHLVNTMGKLMHDGAQGGQVVYPLVDESWRELPERVKALAALKQDINQRDDSEVYDSILLGGMRVVAGNEAALSQLMASLAPIAHYPMRLPNHGAFHSRMMQEISNQAKELMPGNRLKSPQIPLVDGRGNTWAPLSSHSKKLWDYTLGHQVTRTYNFTRAVQNCVKEFAPDCLIIPGPGNTLGGATAQALIDINWQGMSCKQDFINRQENDPFIYSMGREDQRARVVNPEPG